MFEGSRGELVNIAAVEVDWQETHVRIVNCFRKRWPNSDLREPGWRNHGTAVVGVCAADDPSIGIAPQASIHAVSIPSFGSSAGAISTASSILNPGDILLLAIQRPRPAATGAEAQAGIPVEFWYDDLASIQVAVDKGVIVVEAAGNAGKSLDEEEFDQILPGFPPYWINPFRVTGADSGAILVGAGAPPGGKLGPDRSTLPISNYGSRVDCQGWGGGVRSCGYGDLYKGASEDEWYTANFSGTSSASAMIAGCIAAVQGALRARTAEPLRPVEARQMLRECGVGCEGGNSGLNIGRRPEVPQMIEWAFKMRGLI